jgi:hypothetical protein
MNGLSTRIHLADPETEGGRYILSLCEDLLPHYKKPNTITGYDINHVVEMIVLGPRIKMLPSYGSLDLDVFNTTVMLHNTDRPKSLKEEIGFLYTRMTDEQFNGIWRAYLEKKLATSPFSQETREDIVTSILLHPRRDVANPSMLLIALQSADRIVRFGPLGMMGQPSNNRGNPFYNLERPFFFPDTSEKALNEEYASVLLDHIRVLEWYKMLHDDELRSLVPYEWMQWMIQHLIRISWQIRDYHPQVKNTMWEEIEKALGPYATKIMAGITVH